MAVRRRLLAGIIFGLLLFTGVSAFNHAQAATSTNHATTTTTPVVENAGEQVAAETDHEATAEENSGIVGLFGLNWKLFLAQLINFGIILFVLWKWVWGPVTKGLADRTAKIENSLQEAEKISKDREDFDSWKQGEIATVRREAAGILTEAKQSAEHLRKQSLEQTKAEQEKFVAQTQAKLQQEKENLINEAKQEIASLVVQSTELILREKLSPKKDQELIDKALKQLR